MKSSNSIIQAGSGFAFSLLVLLMLLVNFADVYRSLGFPCRAHFQCDPKLGLFCNSTRVCDLQSDIGAPCDDAAHLACQSDRCSSSSSSSSSSSLDNHTCQERLMVGETCQVNEDCIYENYCNALTTRCETLKALGDDCENDSQCLLGRCSSDPPRCTSKLYGSVNCYKDSDCIGGRCKIGLDGVNACYDRKWNDDACNDDSDCLSLRCEELVCTEPGWKDEPCDESSDCFNLFCKEARNRCVDSQEEADTDVEPEEPSQGITGSQAFEAVVNGGSVDISTGQIDDPAAELEDMDIGEDTAVGTICASDGASLSCVISSNPISSGGRYTRVEHAIECPSDTVTGIDFQSSGECTCQSVLTEDAVQNDPGRVRNCDCSICPNGSLQVVALDCGAVTEDPIVVGSCVSFDCNGTCNGTITETALTTRMFDPSEMDPNWPGLYPKPMADLASSGVLIINVQHDDYPEELDWSFSEMIPYDETIDSNVTTSTSVSRKSDLLEGEWSVVGQGGDIVGQLVSYSQTDLKPETWYDFDLTDSMGDGICCTHGRGWITITTTSINRSNSTDDQVIWSLSGDGFTSSAQVHLFVDEDGQVSAAEE